MSYFVKIRTTERICSYSHVSGNVHLTIMDTIDGEECQLLEVFCPVNLVGPLMDAFRSGKDVCLKLNEDSVLESANDINVEITDGSYEAWLNSVLPIDDDVQF